MVSKDDDILNFADDLRPASGSAESSVTMDDQQINVLVVDDEKEVHDVTHMVLNDFSFDGHGINLIDAYSAAEARSKLDEESSIALILLDVVMEQDDSGLELVKYIRESLHNKMVRIILRTGQPGQAPEQDVITEYDINDYKSKTELTIQKLYTSITTSLRSFRDLATIETSRKEIERKNRLNMQMLDSLPCAAMLLESNGDVTLCNQPAMDCGIVIGSNCIADSSGAVPCPWGPLPIDFDRDSVQRWEKEVNEKFYEIFWTPLDTKQYLYYAFDISERKREEAENKRYQKLFQQAQKMESIGLIASGIAHDFNNILAVINGYAEIMTLSLSDGDEHYDSASAILAAGNSGAQLAKKLLSLSRKDKDEFVEVDIHKIIADSVRLLIPSCKNIKLSTQLNAETPLMLGDESLLKNAFINLGVNAKDAMPDGGSISYDTSSIYMDLDELKKYPAELAPGKYIKVEVKDNGTGIDKETLERIFEPLFTTKEPGKGTGLGLAGVYSCANLHKGFVAVDSIVGNGTTFTVLLPLKKDD